MTENADRVQNPFALIERMIYRNENKLIRLQRLLKKRKETLQDFLINFFTTWNGNRETIYIDDNTRQTGIEKRRSLGDIFLICRYYYPDCTLKEVLNILYNVLPQQMPQGFRTSYCSTINKRVWYFNPNSSTRVLNGETQDEFGHDVHFYTRNL